MKYNNASGYSVIISLLLIAFIIVLTTGIFRLVINEMKSNRVMGDYLKAYAGAESAQELALLDIKEKGYGYIGEVRAITDMKSKLLGTDTPFNQNKDVVMSYYNNGRVNSYNGSLSSLSYDIIPLFYIDDTGEKKTNNVFLNVTAGVPSDLSWNIIGKTSGISGIGTNLNNGAKKSLTSGSFEYGTVSVQYFLEDSDTNYLVLFNSGNNNIEYTLEANTDEYFTKPRLDVFSTGDVGEYKQNLKTSVDNTEFLSILKYSIYSN